MKLLSPAKINLFLRVVGRRPDGYHDIFSLMCPVGLYDELELTFGGGKISVSCGHPDVPEDDTNIACVAARLFFEKAGVGNPGVHIRIDKKIPVAAGLGGGSSNAAAVLKGLNRRFGQPFSAGRLRAMGLAVGADVPFFIDCKPAIATGVGEKLELFPDLPEYKVILIHPDIKVSTALVYKNLNLGLTNCEKKLKYPIFKNRGFDLKSHLRNDLEAVAASWHPVISEAEKALTENGADGVLMSGSGPTVFGLYESPEVAAKAAEKLAGGDRSWRVYMADMLL